MPVKRSRVSGISVQLLSLVVVWIEDKPDGK